MRRIVGLALLLIICGAVAPVLRVSAQDIQNAGDAIDTRMRSGAHVDPASLAMQIHIPLGHYAGRAGNDLPITLDYSSKLWRTQFQASQIIGGPGGDVDSTYVAKYADSSAAGWTSSLDWFMWPYSYNGGLRYGDGMENPPVLYTGSNGLGQPCTASCTNEVTRMYAVLLDGSRHELRRDDTVYLTSSNPDVTSGTFYAVDSSRLIYNTANSTLYLPDGSRYVLNAASSTPVEYIDRNGNNLTYSSSGTWTDTLGRTYGRPLGLSQSVGDVTYNVPGVGSSSLTYTLRWRNMSDVLTTSGQLYYTGDRTQAYPHASLSPSLFTSPDDNDSVVGGVNSSSARFDPVVLSQIVLPDGSAYTFTYNVYGEIDKIAYPAGGYEQFTYGAVVPLSGNDSNGLYSQANRGVVTRAISAKGDGSDLVTWQYGGPGCYSTLNRCVKAPDGTTDEMGFISSYGTVPEFGFDDARVGKMYEERRYSSTGQMLRRKLMNWTMTTNYTLNGTVAATRNPLLSEDVEILLDTGGNAQAAMTTYQYDADLNPIVTKGYDYASVAPATAQTGAITAMPQGTLLRSEEATYLVNDPAIPSTTQQAYRANNLLGLVTSTRIKDGSGNIVAQSAMAYDETTPTSNGTVTSWVAPPNNFRGNLTTSKVWLNPTGTWLVSTVAYDSCGNPISHTDPLGHVTTVSYSSTYQYAYPTGTTSAVPDIKGTYASQTALTTSSVYDLASGKTTSTTDANGQITTYQYGDTLNRLTGVSRPDGGSTTYSYGDTPGSFNVCSSTVQNSTQSNQSCQYFDGLGRENRAFQTINTSPYNYNTVDTLYDALGRVSQVSNPYFSTGNGSAVNPSGNWTTTGYDALGRVLSVTTPDSAVASTAYSGAQVLVKDQAGKERMSQTNALGELTDVWEITAADSATVAVTFPGHSEVTAGYHTVYGYDVLEDLKTVTQGAQVRTFNYDSLKRLTSAINPESGTISYSYDSDSNLLTKTDARGVVSTYTYDALNRNTTVTYTSDPAHTPTVTHNFDGATNGKGRPWSSYTSGATGSDLIVDSYDAMGRPLKQRQLFYANSSWSENYTVQQQYDLAGHVISETYPSGHTVTYNYDLAGRIADKDSTHPGFSGNLGEGVQHTYASLSATAPTNNYDAAGHLLQEQYGTATPVYHKLHYNVREQLYDIRLSTSSWQTNEMDWNRGIVALYYDAAHTWGATGTSDNGNVTASESWLPGNDQISTWQATQDSYTYDSLNRISTVTEHLNTSSVNNWNTQNF